MTFRRVLVPLFALACIAACSPGCSSGNNANLPVVTPPQLSTQSDATAQASMRGSTTTDSVHQRALQRLMGE